MTELWRSKFILGTFLSALFVTVSYEIKLHFEDVPFFIMAIFSFILSTYISDISVNLSLKNRIGRKIVMGKAWIEGHWYLSTLETPDKQNQITKSGIVYISYEGDNYVLSVITYRKSTNNIHTGISSLSELATIRSFDLKFSNIFSISDGTSETRGVTTGKFFNDGKGLTPNRFEGHVVLFDEGIYRRQCATKISRKIVKKMIKEYGDSWEDLYIDNNNKNAL